jgi:hypothetical protein
VNPQLIGNLSGYFAQVTRNFPGLQVYLRVRNFVVIRRMKPKHAPKLPPSSKAGLPKSIHSVSWMPRLSYYRRGRLQPEGSVQQFVHFKYHSCFLPNRRESCPVDRYARHIPTVFTARTSYIYSHNCIVQPGTPASSNITFCLLLF